MYKASPLFFSIILFLILPAKMLSQSPGISQEIGVKSGIFLNFQAYYMERRTVGPIYTRITGLISMRFMLV